MPAPRLVMVPHLQQHVLRQGHVGVGVHGRENRTGCDRRAVSSQLTVVSQQQQRRRAVPVSLVAAARAVVVVSAVAAARAVVVVSAVAVAQRPQAHHHRHLLQLQLRDAQAAVPVAACVADNDIS